MALSKNGMKSGFVAILGAPNAGKSTLFNALIGERIAAITPKPQTTRHLIKGILTRDDGQVIFVDTPGIHDGKKEINKYMLEKAWSSLSDTDIVLYLIDVKAVARHASQLDDDMANLRKIEQEKKPLLVLLNKIDEIAKEELLPLIDSLRRGTDRTQFFPVSALKKDGLDPVLRAIMELLPEGPMYYPPDLITESSTRFIVSEIIREKLFILLGEELPYAVSVEVETFKEGEKIIHIGAIVYVERNSQKGIVIGKGGRMLKKIGTLSREAIELFLGRKVYLELFVKVEPDWTRDKNTLKKLGYT